jgi:CCDC81-like prokaryotic HU domain 1/CCDC81-like prokaryotic HU domain 2/SPOR domain
MLTVEGLIGDLLLQHNCVVVPSFGGFVAQRVSAQLDTEKGVMLPPRKSVLFNRQLINNDGLLVAAFAQANQMNYEAAQSEVNQVISNWNRALNTGQRIAIDRVGFLFLDAERNMCFEQDRFYNLLLESFGLGPIHFVSVADIDAKSSIDHVREISKEIETTNQSENMETSSLGVPVFETVEQAPIIPISAKKSNKTWRYIAAACLLPIAFYSIWIPVKTDVLESGVLSMNDFNPFHQSSEAIYKTSTTVYTIPVQRAKRQLETIPENVATFSLELDEDTYIPVNLGLHKTYSTESTTQNENPVAPSVIETVSSTPAVKTSGSYVIVGSFSTRANADNLVNELKGKGFEAQVLESNGTIRVSAGDGSQYNSLAPKLKAEGLAPWLLK